ncbi:hypothetical protein G6F40_017300 [Rhizopus arrhizus]|nr:hypothetical protein G6F40_017300 [Rhizopus arrhizus]
MGAVQQSTQNLEVVKVDVERGLIAVRGAVPGAAGGDVIQQQGLGHRRRVRSRFQRRSGPPGRRCLPQRRPRRHQGTEDSL